ncbi:hypothetical protein F4780DRAFT_682747 [Xylariomycetidae sp. FL0641]|nr:hypothetical protein F4780DRAFT_682747 [Xylariomycetidae sp. FL0641]
MADKPYKPLLDTIYEDEGSSSAHGQDQRDHSLALDRSPRFPSGKRGDSATPRSIVEDIKTALCEMSGPSKKVGMETYDVFMAIVGDKLRYPKAKETGKMPAIVFKCLAGESQKCETDVDMISRVAKHIQHHVSKRLQASFTAAVAWQGEKGYKIVGWVELNSARFRGVVREAWLDCFNAAYTNGRVSLGMFPDSTPQSES